MRTHASALSMVFSRSFANRRHFPSQAKVLSTTHRRRRTSNRSAVSERFTIWMTQQPIHGRRTKLHHAPGHNLSREAPKLGHVFAEVVKRVPKGIICLISALQFHEITLQLPHSVWIAVGSKDRKPAIEYPPIRVVRFGEKALMMGVKTHKIDSVPVRIFGPAKTIVDCFRFRGTVGLNVALEALRMGWRSHKAKPDDIVKYAQALRIWSVVRPYLESVVADEG